MHIRTAHAALTSPDTDQSKIDATMSTLSNSRETQRAVSHLPLPDEFAPDELALPYPESTVGCMKLFVLEAQDYYISFHRTDVEH